MSTDDMAYDYAVGVRETLDEIWAAIDVDGISGRNDAIEELNEMPLELVWEVGEPFAVVLGTGGPHTEITGGGRSGGYVLTVHWGTDTARVSGASVTRTGEHFRELVEADW